jgi:hypothetical protein
MDRRDDYSSSGRDVPAAVHARPEDDETECLCDREQYSSRPHETTVGVTRGRGVGRFPLSRPLTLARRADLEVRLPHRQAASVSEAMFPGVGVRFLKAGSPREAPVHVWAEGRERLQQLAPIRQDETRTAAF